MTDDKQAVDKWLAAEPARKITMAVVNKGIHQGAFDPKAAVKMLAAQSPSSPRSPSDRPYRVARPCRGGA